MRWVSKSLTFSAIIYYDNNFHNNVTATLMYDETKNFFSLSVMELITQILEATQLAIYQLNQFYLIHILLS